MYFAGPNGPAVQSVGLIAVLLLRTCSNVIDNTPFSELHITYINLKLCIVLKGEFFPAHATEAYTGAEL